MDLGVLRKEINDVDKQIEELFIKLSLIHI